MADDPTLAAACTTALLGSGPEVRALRVLFGAALHERLGAAARATATDEAVLRSLDLAYSGAMLWAGMGHIRFDGRARRRSADDRPGLRRGERNARERHGDRHGHGRDGPVSLAVDVRSLQPVRLRDPRGPLSDLRPAAAEAPLYRNDELDFWALSRHADVLAAFRDPAHLSNRFGVTLDPAAYGPHAHGSMSFLAMDPPATPACARSCPRPSPPARVAELEPEIRALAVAATSSRARDGDLRHGRRTWPGSCPWT